MVVWSRKNWLPPLALLGALILAQQTLTLGDSSHFSRALTNAMHIPWSAGVAVVLWWLMGPRASIPRLLAVCVLVAVVTELMQIPTARDASLSDVGRDLIGTGFAAAGLWSYRNLAGAPRIFVCVLVLIGLTAATVFVPGRVALAYQQRDGRFPQLLAPGLSRLSPLWRSNCPVSVAPAPDGWMPFSGARVLRLHLCDETYPGVTLDEVVADWTGYDQLEADVYLPGGSPMDITIAVGHVGVPGTSAYVPVELDPGANLVRIPLTRLITGADGKPAAITHLIVHSNRAGAGRDLFIGRIRLTSDVPPR
ncbi:MAG: hypothetical protein R3E86_11715 [Pseudomonadales bacterium]